MEDVILGQDRLGAAERLRLQEEGDCRKQKEGLESSDRRKCHVKHEEDHRR